MAESRVNSNGVSPFVNYDNGFEDSPVEDKGDSAFSEIETVAFLSMVESLISENLVWVFDFESDANISSGKKIYYKANEAVDINFISRAVNKFNSAYGYGNSVTLTEFIESNAPIATNYASIAYNLDACTVIWPDDHSAGVIDRETIQYADFIGNLLFETAMNSGTLKENRFKPFTKHVMWRSRSDDDCFSVKSSAAPMWISAYENRVDGVCNVSMNGYVIVEAEEVSRVRIKPILYQKNSPTDDYETRFNSNIFDIEINVNAGINVIPFNSVLSCKHSNIINTPSYLCSVIAAACTKPVKITGFSYTLNIIPSDERNAVEVLVPTGLVSDYTDENTTPVFAVEYPKNFYDIV